MTVKELIEKAEVLVGDPQLAADLVSGLNIEDVDGLKRAVELAQAIAANMDRVDLVFADEVKAADKAHKTLTGAKNKLLKPIKDADASLRDKIKEFICVKGDEASSLASNVAGLSYRTDVKCEVEDITKLAKAVIAGKVPPSVLSVDSKALRDFAKTGMPAPGVSVIEVPVITIRREGGD